MEFEENKAVEEQKESGEPVEIYSRRAIWWFSVPSPIVGGVLLSMNLYAAGFKRAVYGVMAFSVLFYVAVNIAADRLIMFYHLDVLKLDVNHIDPDTQMKFLKIGAIGLGLNIIGGTVLAGYFFKKYFPDNDYYPKSITKPLIITIIVILVMNYLGSMGI